MPLDVDSLTPSELVAAAGQLCDTLTGQAVAASNCFAGAADGGPDGDGYFPFPVLGTPDTVMLPSMAKIAADAAPYVVGLFGAIATRPIPAAVTRIQTTGKDVVGKGGAVYGVTSNTGTTAYRIQGADGRWWELLEKLPALWDFGWSDTDCGTAILAGFAWAGNTGRALILPPVTFRHLDPLLIAQTGLTLEGVGWESQLRGPGVKAAGTVNTHNGPRNLTFRNFKMLGVDYQDDGDRAIDILATNEVTIEGMYFEGYHDQVVLDQIQRTRVRASAFLASAGTRCGLWYPRGPEAHAGVSLSSSASNIASVDDNHLNWVANPDGWGFVDHGGLQHRYTNNQVSQGRAAMRIGNNADITIAHADYEFTTTYSLECVNTAFDGTVIGYASQVNVGPGNYFDKPAKMDGVFSLNVRDNNLRVVPATFTGMASVRMLRSSGNKCPTGRTLYDTMPAADGWSWVREDEEGAVAVIGQAAEDGIVQSGPLSISNSSGGHTGVFRLDDGTGRTRWFYDSIEFRRVNSSAGYEQLGNATDGLVGPRLFGFGGDPTGRTIVGVTDGSLGFEALGAGAAYDGRALIRARANGAWIPLEFPAVRRTSAFLATPPTSAMKGRQVLITDRGTVSGSSVGRMAYAAEDLKWRWVDDYTTIAT